MSADHEHYACAGQGCSDCLGTGDGECRHCGAALAPGEGVASGFWQNGTFLVHRVHPGNCELQHRMNGGEKNSKVRA